MNDDWLKHIHDSMADYETDEPVGLWQSIEKSLPTQTRRKPVFGVWTRYAAAIVLLCAIFAVLKMNTPQHSPSLAIPELTLRAYTLPRPIFVSPAAKEATTAKTINLAHISKYGKNGMFAGQQPGAAASQADYQAHTTATEEPAAPPAPQKTQQSSLSPKKQRQVSSPTPEIKPSYSSPGRLSVSLAASSGTASLFAQNRTASGPYMYSSPNGVAWQESAVLGMLVSSKGQNIETEYKHKLPVKTGLSFMYTINDRLSVGSGLTYSYLVSDVKTTFGNTTSISRQKLHYIGLPVNVRLRIASWGRFDIYTIAGATLEKCIAARTDTDDSGLGINNRNLTKPFQFSVNAGTGIQCNISDHLGLYAEPGAAYYFNDGSSLKTFYKDKPLNFSLDFGLRFTFD